MNNVEKNYLNNKKFIIEKISILLNKVFNNQYYYYNVKDMYGNIADILVKENSKIFKENIEKKDFIDLNVEELIDSRMFDNYDEIIIIDLNCEENYLDYQYLSNSLDYYYLSYSKSLSDILKKFVNYIVNKNIQ